MTVAQLTRLTEAEARTWIENIRWPTGPVCPRCNGDNAVRMGGQAAEKGLCKCRDCRKNFTVRIGTIFEESPLPLRDWVYAFARMCASKKGISAHQLHRELGITYKTAWFMCHRIRHAMSDGGGPFDGAKLTGTVEADETYVGGKPRYKGISKAGRGTKKTPVAVLVERDGKARARVVCDVTAKTLKGNIRTHVAPDATIMTDEFPSYAGIGKDFAGGHQTVNHGAGEYAREDGANTNTAESYFALLKRGMYGTFHHCSKRHLQRYCDEFDFRWNHRETNDAERILSAVGRAEGKRLMYKKSA